MKKSLIYPGLGLLLALAAPAQNTNLLMPPGKIAVFKAGDGSTTWAISSAKAQPCFVQVYDTVTNNQAAPLLSVPLPTNGPGSVWINAHAGSEGGGISLTANRQFLALEGYTGNIISPSAAKPSSATNVTRGVVTLDAFTNVVSIYSDLANWFGMPPGVSQNNPTGIASTDGTNFWGTGNVTGTSSEASGTLFFNAYYAPYSGLPVELQNQVQAAGQARIINGVLYIVVPGGGVYDFVDPVNGNALVPLPFDPDVANPVEHVVKTNLVINWGSTFKNIANFDMNAAGTIAYGADQSLGIVKFTNNAGSWVQAPYYFSATNLGTLSQVKADQGCFGICVDFSGTNPVIYATTMEFGNTSVGNPNQNRLIAIVDNGSPGTNLVAQTLATAGTTNENFRGIDFTPDLRPYITSAPVSASTASGGSASFTVGAISVYADTYQWLQNGTNLPGKTSSTLNFSNLQTNSNGYIYQCVVANKYGSVTSTPPAVLTVNYAAVPPVISGAAAHVTNYIGSTETFPAISAVGTQPINYQWYFGSTLLVDDGVKYSGAATASLTISNLDTPDSGNYYVVAANTAGTASNLVDVLTVAYQLPIISAGGQPQSAATFVGLTTSLSVTPTGGTQPLTYQWYQGTTALSDGAEFTGSASSLLTISPAGLSDAGSYTVVISNGGGSVTSAVAAVTVLIAPAPSFVGYSNQVYIQNFDSLPDPGSNSMNSINNPKDAGSINGLAYSLANPFDFSYPVITSSYVGGLGLSNTMPGWYGAADLLFPGVDGITRFGAQDGDQTTGGVIDFGPNDNNGVTGTNRALGLLSTSTTGGTSFALKLVNTSSNTFNYMSLGFIGELWHNGTQHRLMSFGYTVDATATNFSLTAESISNSTLVPSLAFSFPVAAVVMAVDGASLAYQTNLATNSVPLSTPWAPGGALWLIWGIDYYGSGSGNGYAIDNLNFQASVNPVVIGTAPVLGGVTYSGTAGLSFGFTNITGASFTVYGTSSLNAPISWTVLGHPTEGSTGIYQFTDSAAIGASARYYKVSSP